MKIGENKINERKWFETNICIPVIAIEFKFIKKKPFQKKQSGFINGDEVKISQEENET